MDEQGTNSGRLVRDSRVRAAAAGVVYFLVVFTAGWVLGPIRTLWAVPRFGALTEMLMEAPPMAIAMFFATKSAVRRFAVDSVGATICMGAFAFGLLIPAEIGGVWLRRLTVHEYLQGMMSLPCIVSLSLFLLFAAMPSLIAMSHRRETRTAQPAHARCPRRGVR
jgi:hypothetical protein